MLCRFSLLVISSILVLVPLSASGQVPFPNYPEPDLPRMAPCANRTPVPLPEKWQATTLMSPYLYLFTFPRGANLEVGRFVYDSEAGAMRVALYQLGTERVLDYLITRDATYFLGGTWDRPTCRGNLGKLFKVPGRVWQESTAVCVGNHATAPTIHTGPAVDWWKQPSPVKLRGAEGQAGDWYWFDENGYPTRTFFWANHPGLPAGLGWFAYTNFYSFEPVGETNLGFLAAECAKEHPPKVTREEHFTLVNDPENQLAVHEETAEDLIPGLSFRACSGSDIEPPHWPEEIYITSFSTAAKFATPVPIPTSVYYDPAGPNLRTRLHKVEKNSNTGQLQPVFSDALLLNTNSYGVDFEGVAPYTQLDCAQGPHTSIPGAPHPDWGARGGCTCMGVLENNPVLSPGRKTQIIACPLADYSGSTLFWMWYTVAQPPEPIVFLQTRADITIGTGLSLADYFHWEEPTSTPIDPVIYTVPDHCEFPPGTSPTPPPACLYCHNPSTNGGHGLSTKRW